MAIEKESKFMEWFNEILQTAEIYDYRYPIKGMGVWRPYGFLMRENMLKIIRKCLNETGHQEVLFPLLIPETNLRKESEHITAFEEEVYWVTHGGKDKLKIKYALRPTSETAIYPMYALWIRSYKDLPIKYYQVVNIFRYETKTTRPLIRVREVTTFKEAHTVHATRQETEEQIKEAIQVYSKIFDELALPYLVLKRPAWDKFAGSEYSVAFDTIMPNGKRLQIGTVHFLGQNFSKVFEIKYLKPDGSHEYVYQTCYGISSRPLAAVIAIHSDERGLILPPSISPYHAVIIPIYYKEGKEKVLGYSLKIKNKLLKSGFRVKEDFREEETPGSKFYFWEMKGIPLRIEVGMEEVNNQSVTVVRRDNRQKVRVEENILVTKIRELLDKIQKGLKEKADKWMQEKIVEVHDLRDAVEKIGRGFVVKTWWCGEEKCGRDIEDKTNAKVFGFPFPWEEKQKETSSKKCILCGKKAKFNIFLGKSY